MIKQLETQVSDLVEKLEKQETYIEFKETKWFAIEKIIKQYASVDFDLERLLKDVKFDVKNASELPRISNVVARYEV